MIRSALRSVSYVVEDVVSVARWVVGEVVAELDYRLQPVHVRQGWAAELADIEAGVDVHEPNAPYLQWGGPETWPQPEGQIEVRQHFGVDVDRILQNSPYCNRCGYPHPTTQTCLRDESSAVPPAADRPAGVVADPPSAPPAGHPHVEAFVPEEDRIATSTLLREAANYIDAVFPVCDSKYVGRLTTNLRKRSAAFAAVENTT